MSLRPYDVPPFDKPKPARQWKAQHKQEALWGKHRRRDEAESRRRNIRGQHQIRNWHRYNSPFAQVKRQRNTLAVAPWHAPWNRPRRPKRSAKG
jgi:hypothetical protein